MVEAREPVDLPLDVPVVLLDVPVHDRAALGLVVALAGRATRLLATVPRETTGPGRRSPGCRTPRRRRRRGMRPPPTRRWPACAPGSSSPSRPRRRRTPAPPADEVSFFSAPGESRECVEIARLVQREAATGVPLDRMAVVLRSPQVYSGLLETALRRAGVEAWFVRGTRAPDPAGRAFLALLATAAEQLSARRFSEYLSLGQVPEPDPEGAPPVDRARWVPPAEAEQVLPAAALPVQGSLFDVADLDPGHDDPDPGAPPDADDRPVVGGTLRAPWHWDRLLVESAVIGGRDRWARRLAGLERELRLRLEECDADDPRSPRVRRLERDLVDLGHLRRFALPVMDRLDAFPHEAPWGDWLDRLEALAPMVLRRPDRVLATLGELRPMAGVGPVSLTEVQDVLAERLTELQAEPPARRYGRVFVGGPEHVRGRIFDVVFVPGLAERMFPQKPRQDPILLDDVRRRLNAPDAMRRRGPETVARCGAARRPPDPAGFRAVAQGADADPLGLPVLDDRAAAGTAAAPPRRRRRRPAAPPVVLAPRARRVAPACAVLLCPRP